MQISCFDLKKAKHFQLPANFLYSPGVWVLQCAAHSQGTRCVTHLVIYTPLYCQADPNPKAVWEIITLMSSMSQVSCVYNPFAM